MLFALGLRWRGCELGHVALDESPPFGLVQQSAQDGVDLADRCRREASLAQLRVESIDLERRELREADSAEHGGDLPVHVLAVVIQRGCRSAEPGDVLQPAIEQIREGWVVECWVVERDPAIGHGGLQFGECCLRLALRSWVFVVRPLGFEPRTCGLRVGFSLCQPVLPGVVWPAQGRCDDPDSTANVVLCRTVSRRNSRVERLAATCGFAADFLRIPGDRPISLPE